MKNLKATILVMLISISMGISSSSKAKAPVAPVIWEFYSATYDMTVYYNPISNTIDEIDYANYYYTQLDNQDAVTYFPVDDVLYASNFKVEAYLQWDSPLTATWVTIVGPFERVN